MALCAELQAVLQEGVWALHHEDRQEWQQALESYNNAKARLKQIIGTCQQQHGSTSQQLELAGVCRMLLDTYNYRMQIIATRDERLGAYAAAGMDLHLVEPESPASPPAASATSDSTFSLQSASLTIPPICPACPVASHATASSMQPDAMDMEVPQRCSQTLRGSMGLELLQQCQKEVHGSLDDVSGLTDIKLELEEAIFLPMHRPDLFKGIRTPPRSFLLYGPPGTGKTMLVEKVAAEAKMTLLAVSPSTILSKWSGESERTLRLLFDVAKAMQAIIFMDEVDSLGQARGAGDDGGSRRLLTELLIQMNGLQEHDGVIVFAATNRMQDCDPALLRRFARRIEVPLPCASTRREFMQSVLAQPEVGSALSEAQLAELSLRTQGYSGSDLAALCKHAAMAPLRELLQKECKMGGSKRRRLPASAVGHAQAQESVAATGSAGGSNGGRLGADMQTATELQSKSTDTAAPELRKLCMSDFEAALASIRPAASDGGDAASA